jgi:glutaredoxin
MILRAFFLLIATALAASGTAWAQAYRWIDKDGKVQFTDTPPPPGAKDVRKTAAPAAPAEAATSPQLPFEIARLQKDFPVTLYTSPSCKEGCDLARAALNKRGVPFKEVQIWNAEGNEELKRVSGAVEVPTLLVGRSAQRGFEQGAFDLLLDSAGYPKAGLLPPLSQKAPGSPEGYVSPNAPQQAAQPAAPTEPAAKSGPYDPSGLQGPAPKQGIYGLPGESDKK